MSARAEHPAIALRAEGLSKRYRRGPPAGLDASVARFARGRLRRALGLSVSGSAGMPDLFWALRDVDLSIERGSAVGVLGRNAAGKSTLLKLLARITPPTRGRAWVNGRCASLLEVGTGFQPDLSGRENVYLNGAILGMRRAEVRRVFDDIVAFAEVEAFVDTPVKRYSSGMFTRLAFAVAAHLPAEILLVDEVLAVGDAAFAQRCIDSMRDATREGRTVVFVSHRSEALRRLCPRSLYLEGGRVVGEGDTDHLLRRYARDVLASSPSVTAPDGVRVTGWSLDDGEDTRHACVSGESIELRMALALQQDLRDVVFELRLLGADREPIMASSSLDDGGSCITLTRGAHILHVRTALPLVEGSYALELGVGELGGRIAGWHGLSPRMTVLPRGQRRLDRHQRGVLDSPTIFTVAGVHR